MIYENATGKKNFKTLKELIDEELHKLEIPNGFQSIEDFITDGQKSTEFIRTILNDESFAIPDKSEDLYEIAEMRARHSAVTFLVGLAIKQFGGLFDKIPAILNTQDNASAMHMWLITSLYHDKAYESKYIKRTNFDITKKFAPFLLTDNTTAPQMDGLNNFSVRYPNTLAYTYDTILAYDRYAIHYHQRHGSEEKRDHGILGGVMMFSKLADKAIKEKRENELPIIKSCSLAVAQHNIFKADKKYDDDYRDYGLEVLLSTSRFRIAKEKTLVLFLSLVDTIECVKKFSKSQNISKYFETLTTLKQVKMAVNEERIEIDLSELANEIRKKKSRELEESLENYKKALIGIGEWTKILSKNDPNNDNFITIQLDKSQYIPSRVLATAGAI